MELMNRRIFNLLTPPPSGMILSQTHAFHVICFVPLLTLSRPVFTVTLKLTLNLDLHQTLQTPTHKQYYNGGEH